MTVSNRPMNDWFKGIKKTDDDYAEKKKARLAELKAAEPAFRVLKTLLERDIDNRRSSQVSNQRYEEPQWAYKQADLNGSIREIERILKMLPLEG